MSMKMFDGETLPHELLLTTRQKTEQRNAYENNMAAYIELPKTNLSKITQSGCFLRALLCKIAGPLMKVAVALAKYILAPL